MYDRDKRKVLSALCHGSIFGSSSIIFFGIPLGILLISDDPVVKDNAKEALNFHFNIWVYEAIIGAICFVLFITIIGIPLAWLLIGLFFLFHWIPAFLAILKALSNPDSAYRYPFIVHIL
jgi:uncharacterized protein